MRKAIGPLLYAGFVIFFSLEAYLKPAHNWDMIPYIACALSYEEDSKVAVHHKTYRIVEESVWPSEYVDLAARTPFRRSMAQNPVLFYQQLNFYHLRPLYISSIYILHKLGVPLVKSTVLTSVISALCISAILILWISGHASPFHSALISAFLLIAAGLPTIARLSTPDALSSALVFLSFFVLIEKRLPNLACLLMIASLLARPDNVILCLLFVGYLRLTSAREYRIGVGPYFLFMILIFLTYLGILAFSKPYRWWTVFSHTFLGRMISPAEAPSELSLSSYFVTFKEALGQVYLMRVSFFLLLSALTAVLSDFRLRTDNIPLYSTLLALVSLVIHFVLFPALWDRFFAAHYLVIGAAFVIGLQINVRLAH
jgi:hypothetical protein